MNHSQHLGLSVSTNADPFRTTELAANWQLLDAYPGIYLCTSVSRPTGWGATQIGMSIFEADTRLVWRWDGTLFYRANAKGWLNGNSIAADFSTASTTPAAAISQLTAVPAGDRNIKITVSYNRVENTNGRAVISVWRDSVQVQEYEKAGLVGGTAATAGEGDSVVVWDKPGASGGSFTYSFRIAATVTYGGTSWVRAAAGKIARIDIEET